MKSVCVQTDLCTIDFDFAFRNVLKTSLLFYFIDCSKHGLLETQVGHVPTQVSIQLLVYNGFRLFSWDVLLLCNTSQYNAYFASTLLLIHFIDCSELLRQISIQLFGYNRFRVYSWDVLKSLLLFHFIDCFKPDFHLTVYVQ